MIREAKTLKRWVGQVTNLSYPPFQEYLTGVLGPAIVVNLSS